MTNPVDVEIYSRPGCHLCDEVKEVIERVRRRLGFAVRVINIETDPELEKNTANKSQLYFLMVSWLSNIGSMRPNSKRR